MTSRDFVYWLQGFFELRFAGPLRSDPTAIAGLSPEQVEVIKRHLALVFKHEIDPSVGSVEHQEELNAAHKPPSKGGSDGGGTVYRC
jgi:hypothetical protein